MDDNWLKNIDPNDLIPEAPALTYFNVNSNATIDDVAQFMVKDGVIIKYYIDKIEREEEDKRPPKEYWELVKEEFFTLLCTQHSKYAQLREKLKKATSQSSTVIVGILSAFIAKEIGVAAGSITGLCAVCLYGAVKIGKEALCEYIKERDT